MLHSYWGLCFELLEYVQDFRSKNLLLDCILSGSIDIVANVQKDSVAIKNGRCIKKDSIIIKIGQKLIPFADKLVDYIQKAWEVSTGEMFLQIKGLRELYSLSELGVQSHFSYKILLRILERFSSLNDPDRLVLLNYGMVLWESIVSHAPLMDTQLLELFIYLRGIMKYSLHYFQEEKGYTVELLKIAVKIIDGYINLGGRRFMTQYASVVHDILVGICGDANFILKGRNSDKNHPKLNIVAGKFNSGKRKGSKTSAKEQKDEKNVGVLDKIKKRDGRSSSSESPSMRVAERKLHEDLRMLQEISIRSAGIPKWQPFSDVFKDLRETLASVQDVEREDVEVLKRRKLVT